MRIMKPLLLPLILAASLPIATVQVAPADVRAAVAAPGRPAEAVALDESRKPVEVLMHLVYHDTYWVNEEFQFPQMDPDAFLAKIFEATKPGGIVGVVDHIAAPGGDTRAVVRELHRIDPAVLRADFERAWLELQAESDLLRNPADDHSKLSLDPAIRGKTDRIIYRFRKPG